MQVGSYERKQIRSLASTISTFLSTFLGCGLLFGAIWKLSGAESLQDFRQKAGRILPVIPKKPPEAGERTEFSGEIVCIAHVFIANLI